MYSRTRAHTIAMRSASSTTIDEIGYRTRSMPCTCRSRKQFTGKSLRINVYYEIHYRHLCDMMRWGDGWRVYTRIHRTIEPSNINVDAFGWRSLAHTLSRQQWTMDVNPKLIIIFHFSIAQLILPYGDFRAVAIRPNRRQYAAWFIQFMRSKKKIDVFIAQSQLRTNFPSRQNARCVSRAATTTTALCAQIFFSLFTRSLEICSRPTMREIITVDFVMIFRCRGRYLYRPPHSPATSIFCARPVCDCARDKQKEKEKSIEKFILCTFEPRIPVTPSKLFDDHNHKFLLNSFFFASLSLLPFGRLFARDAMRCASVLWQRVLDNGPNGVQRKNGKQRWRMLFIRCIVAEMTSALNEYTRTSEAKTPKRDGRAEKRTASELFC